MNQYRVDYKQRGVKNAQVLTYWIDAPTAAIAKLLVKNELGNQFVVDKPIKWK